MGSEMCIRDRFSPLYKNSDSMEIFKNIDIQKDQNSLAFLIKEALEEKAPFAESGQNSLQIESSIKNSYGVITKENEITRYSVTLNVEYRLYNKKTKKVVSKNKVSATSDYSAAVTFTGFATEIARKDTYERLADTVAEKMITEILISNLSEYAPWFIIGKRLTVSPKHSKSAP